VSSDEVKRSALRERPDLTNEKALWWTAAVLGACGRSELIQKLGLVDNAELAKRLREGGPLLKYERDFLADLVEGKRPPFKGRPPSVDTALRDDVIAEWYLHLKAYNLDLQKRQIEYAIATGFGKSPEWVRRAVRSLNPQRRKEIEREIAEDLAERAFAAALEAK
jgi:hypothetical protein